MDQTDAHTQKQPIAISRSDRWQAYHRLQDLGIACNCLQDGSFVAEINSPIAALQMRSVIAQLTATRQQLIDWLNHCWHYPPPQGRF